MFRKCVLDEMRRASIVDPGPCYLSLKVLYLYSKYSVGLAPKAFSALCELQIPTRYSVLVHFAKVCGMRYAVIIGIIF
jgi:hypothetical protein